MSTISKEYNLLLITIESIKNDDIDQLDNCLRVMPIEKLVDQDEILLSNLLSICAAYNREEASKLILERWKVIYPDQDKITMLPRLFMKNIINISTLSYLASVHKDVTFVEIVDELTSWDSSEGVATACDRADKIYGQQSYITYKMLRENAVEVGNFKVEEFLIDKMTKVSPFAEKPEYIKNYLAEYFPEYKNKLPTQEQLDQLAQKDAEKEVEIDSDTIVLPDDDEAITLMTEGLKSAGISIFEIDRAKEFLRNEIKSLDRKKELLLPILKNMKQLNLETDRLLFWIYGPTNPLINQNLTLDTPSAKYGGCRQFLCNIFDYNEDEQYFEEWFLGYCEECLLRIEKQSYAVRMPRPHGGWEGCYCSYKCVRSRLEFVESQEMKPDLLTHALIDAFEKKTIKIGIQDRI